MKTPLAGFSLRTAWRWIPAAAFVATLVAGRAASGVIMFNDDGAWNWLQDDRAIVADGKLIVGSVAAGARDPNRRGDVEAVAYDLRTGEKRRHTLHHAATPAEQKQWYDDHNCPALLARPDGRVLAVYSQHGRDEKLLHRLSSAAGTFSGWEDELVFALPASARVTFPNLLYLSAENDGRGRLLNFFRGLERKNMPSWSYSDDGGLSWNAGTIVIDLPSKDVPYVKFAGNGRDTIHLAFTDGHRVSYGNGVHHVFYRDGFLHTSDGRRIRSLREGLKRADEATGIFQANQESVTMISDLRLDADGNPHVVYSVQKDTGSLRPRRPIGADHRYRYARWTGSQWQDREIAFAGGEVHAVEDDDCTGLITLDPQDVSVVYVSSNADPATGAPLLSAADGKRHWELFQGRTPDGGVTWTWTALTRDSTHDNIRPVAPTGMTRGSAVLWLRGTMRLPNDYDFAVVGLISEQRPGR
ncbi:MAG: hypothetical protein RIQ93_65 [Verrucomicrobiota bacterium]|jgi:hypothetical protein